MAEWKEEVTRVAGTDLAIIKGGRGKPLLVLHEELGHPGWLNWHDALAEERTLIIPIQPGMGNSPRVEDIRNVHQLGLFYGWVLRDLGLAPIDVIGFSFGAWTAAEMATANASQFRKMVLVAPMGIRPPEGELMDVFTVTIGAQLGATVYDRDATPEYNSLYGGGERSASRMEAFEDARSETARLAWEPILNNPTLPYFLQGVKGLPTQLIWGREDRVVPVSAATAYKNALANTEVRLALFDQCGHRPEIEQREQFLKTVREFLA
ncbi:MAG TPA: alpha/beta fold hydrolase [Candidatus Binataceae bacterium]|jgi:pimeloyl-ACP methyl ester carboxylesterase|nr:alpha/beta fold hydrolase [Candidatus Binataceae bacterium]